MKWGVCFMADKRRNYTGIRAKAVFGRLVVLALFLALGVASASGSGQKNFEPDYDDVKWAHDLVTPIAARHFDSDLELAVYVVRDDGNSVLVGSTPSGLPQGLLVPKCLGWYVQPVGTISADTLLREAVVRKVYGIAIGRSEREWLNDNQFVTKGRRNITGNLVGIGELENLSWLELSGDVSDEEAIAIGGLQALRFLDLSDARVNDVALAVMCKAPALRILRLPIDRKVPQVLEHILALTAWGADTRDAQYIAGLDGLRALEFMGAEGSADRPLNFSRLTSLRRLQMLYAPNVVGLAACLDLESITITYHDVTRREIREIASLPRLRELTIDVGQLTGLELRELRKAPSLNRLNLGESAIDDEALKEVGDLIGLRELHVSSWNLTNVHALSSLKQLEHLGIGRGSSLDGETVGSLCELRALRDLHISGVPIGETGLTRLSGLPCLERLRLSCHGEIGDGCVEAIAKARPKLDLTLNERDGK